MFGLFVLGRYLLWVVSTGVVIRADLLLYPPGGVVVGRVGGGGTIEEGNPLLMENPELSGTPSGKPGVGQNIALHASLTARNISISSFCLES